MKANARVNATELEEAQATGMCKIELTLRRGVHVGREVQRSRDTLHRRTVRGATRRLSSSQLLHATHQTRR